MAKITLTSKCPFCGTERQKEFDEEQYRKYQAGAYIQDAMPDTSPDDREFLLTGICPDCWHKECWHKVSWRRLKLI